MKEDWISITEKLPELDTRVLVSEHGHIHIANYCKLLHPKNTFGFMDEQDEQPSVVYATHWQPLPAPPKSITPSNK